MTNLEVPQQFSDVFGMGGVTKVYKGKTSQTFHIIMIVIFLGGAGAAVLRALWALWNKWGVYYPPVVLKEVGIWLVR